MSWWHIISALIVELVPVIWYYNICNVIISYNIPWQSVSHGSQPALTLDPHRAVWYWRRKSKALHPTGFSFSLFNILPSPFYLSIYVELNVDSLIVRFDCLLFVCLNTFLLCCPFRFHATHGRKQCFPDYIYIYILYVQMVGPRGFVQ